ncbi:hypothetical protein C348_06163 [Cryptococcus neoformans Gb118]|nr:hypothetical protein C350_06148 [Cryptococcus neoformans var. grubii MW-RSA36]OXL05683.1 hypothetical protein C348_06163 [Cryptococcus neoformans var. grubii Gb118]
MSGRKAYSCTPCRTKKIKCDRRKVCGRCIRKSIECIWPENGVPLEDEIESPAGPVLSSPRNTPHHPHTFPPSIPPDPSYQSAAARPSVLPSIPSSSLAPVLSSHAPSHIHARPPLTSQVNLHTHPHHSQGHGHIPPSTSISIVTSATRTRTQSLPPPAAVSAAPMVDVPHTVVHAEQLDHSILNDPDPPGSSSDPSSPRTSDRAGGIGATDNATPVESHPGRLDGSDRDSRTRANGGHVNRASGSKSLAGKEDAETSRDYTFTQPMARERGEREGRVEASEREYGGAMRPLQDEGREAQRARRVDQDTPATAPGTAIITKAVDEGSTNREAVAAAAEGSTGAGGATSKSRRHRSYPFHLRGINGDGMVTDELMMALPPHSHADALLRVYLERVEWIHHPLHLPTFLAQYNKFWSMSPSHRCSTVHSRWLALLYIILCLGDHFGDENMSTDDTLEGQLLVACEDCLAHADFLDEPSTETIQTIICLNLYLNNKNRVNAARSLLGTAIKMAIAMGMSRIPDESVLYDPAGVIEREVGRRLWWSLVTQDAYTASNSGFTYLINLSHASTGLFANLDDDEIRPTGFHSPSKPLSETTTATYHILKIDFALVVRHFIDAINVNFPNASYEAIMELDLQFRQVYDSLPAPFRPDLPQPFELSYAGSKRYLVEQRIFMGITLHNRIMRLHRAYMVRGYEDPKYEYSTRVCLESAYALLDLVRQSPQTLCRWWVVLVQVWTGGLIISADLVRGARDERERRRQRDGVALAVSLLEPISRTSPVARRGLKVLRALLSRDSEVSQAQAQIQSHTQSQSQSQFQAQAQNQNQNQTQKNQGQIPRKRKHSHGEDGSEKKGGDGNAANKGEVDGGGVKDKGRSVHENEDTDRSEPSQLDLANTSLTDLEHLLRQAFPFANPSSSSLPSVSSFISPTATSANSPPTSGSASAPGLGSGPGPAPGASAGSGTGIGTGGVGMGSVSDGGMVSIPGTGMGPTTAATSDAAAEFWHSLFSMNSW